MPKSVLLLGGTGYVGKAVANELIKAGFQPLILTRKGSENKLPKNVMQKSIIIFGDASNINEQSSVISQHKPICTIYLIGLLRENRGKNLLYKDFHYHWAKSAIALSTSLSIPKFIFMSANGVEQKISEYQTTKLATEDLLKKTRLDWTIIRPSVIAGEDIEAHFLTVIIALINKKIVPLLGDGSYRLSPVYRADVAKIIAESILNTVASKKTYEICGQQAYSYKEIINMTAKKMHKRILFVQIPKIVAGPLVSLMGKYSIFPISSDQYKMLLAENVCHSNQVWEELNLKPTPFSEVLKEYAQA